MNKDFLLEYLNTNSPSGHETGGQRVWMKELEKWCNKINHDHLGSVWGNQLFNNNNIFGNPVKIVLEAHADEISWMVSEIDSNGFIWLARNGGIDAQVAPGTWGEIMTEGGIVKGVFGIPAIHSRDKDWVTKADKIYLDVFCKTLQEVLDKGICLGDPVIQSAVPQIIGNTIISKALDNKLGGFVVAQVAQKIAELEASIKPPVYENETVIVDTTLSDKSLYYVNTVQEEVGCRGVGPLVEHINPDISLVIDVCHDVTAPLYNPKKDGNTKGGLGPVISHSSSINKPFLKWIKGLAKENGIPLQEIVDPNSTHTDADSWAYKNRGSVTCLFSIPLKYMHTSVETVDLADVEALINLLVLIITKLDTNKDWRPLSN
jgi:putative aminopeptidase FrvX